MIVAGLCLLFSCSPNPGDTLLEKGRVVAADLDVQGNVYFLDSAYQLCKTGTQKAKICNAVGTYGEEAIIDADNPLEPMVFFQNSGILVINDNNLNQVATINLFADNNLKPGGFGRANDGNIWIFDDNSSTLKKIDRSGNIILESMVLCEKGNKPRKPSQVYDNGLMLALTLPNQSIVVMDANLNTMATLPANQGRMVDIAGKRIVLQKDSVLYLTETFQLGKKQPSKREATVWMESDSRALAMRGKKTLILNNKGLILRQP